MGAPLGVIQNQGPVIDPDGHVGESLGIERQARQRHEATCKIIAEIADGTAHEGQPWHTGVPGFQDLAQQKERVVRRTARRAAGAPARQSQRHG
jgi:hypothetical protein